MILCYSEMTLFPSRTYFVPKKQLMILSTVSVSKTKVTLRTYILGEENDRRTHLFVIPAVIKSFTPFLCFESFPHSSSFQKSSRRTQKANQMDPKRARRFTTKLHVLSHLIFRDTKKICRRTNIPNDTLAKEFGKAHGNYVSWKRSGRPLHSRIISFSRLSDEFIEHLQVDVLCIRELRTLPIIHVNDVATVLLVTVLMTSRDMTDCARMIKLQ